MKSSLNFKTSLYLFIFIFPLIQLSLQAQSKDSDTSIIQDKKKMTLFYEKVYLHTDRSYYSSGDNIWFKAYLVNAISNIPLLETSRNLYVELISNDALIIDHKLIRLNSGMGNGDFTLPDSIPGGTYKLRAYTNWMRNFGELFLFEKELQIFSIPGIKPNTTKAEKQKPTIQFFPESGSLISEAINTVAFKAIDESGKGCNAKGVVISSANDTVCEFKASYLGMGTFAYMPLEGIKYFAIGSINNTNTFKTELPQTLAKGIGMNVYDIDTASFFISIYTNQATLNENLSKRLIINCMAHNKNNYTGYVTLKSLKNDIRIPKKYFSEGIASITLYDTLIRPHCQRLIYIHKKENQLIALSTNKPEYQPREEVTVSIKITDAKGLPLKTQFSLAAIDNGLVPDDVSNITSYLMLESEVKGRIEEPKNYFDLSNSMRYKQLDLLLLTQGWRDFIWRRIKDSVPTIKYMVEPGIILSGRVRQKFINKPISNSSVQLLIPESKNVKLYYTETNDVGNYYLHGIEIYGNNNITLSSSNGKGKNLGWIFLDNPDTSRYPVTPFNSGIDENLNKSIFAKESSIRKSITKKYTLTDTIQLAEVVVSGAEQKKERQNQKFYINGATIDIDIKINPEDENMDIGTFMATRIPGAQISNEAVEEGPVASNRILIRKMGQLEPPSFILDGHPFRKGDIMDESVIYNLSMGDIDRIIVSKSDIKSGGIGSYVIGIFTKPNTGEKKLFYSINKNINGYYEAQTFYSPVYPDTNYSTTKPDLRTTLYWSPNLSTNENGECKVTFFNSDKNTSVKISIEGITDKGFPIINTAKYEIKK